MGYLPPVGWVDVATKHDLAHLESLLRSETATMRAEIVADITRDVGAMSRNLVFALTGAYTAVSGMALAVSQVI